MRKPITAENADGLKQIAQATRGWISEVRWSPNGKALAVAAAAGVALFSMDDAGLTLRGVLEGHSAPVKGVAVNVDGSMIASASSDTTVRLWNLRGSSITISGHTDAVNTVAINETYLASAGRDIRLWDIESHKLLRVFDGHTDEITSVMFAGDNRLVSGSWDKTARVWDTETGENLAVLQHDDWVREVTCHGDLIATACKDMSVRLWELNGEARGLIYAHDGGADSVGFSPDGSLLASGGRDNLVKLWRVGDLQQIGELAGHTKPVLSVAFSRTLLASGSGDNSLRIWGVDS